MKWNRHTHLLKNGEGRELEMASSCDPHDLDFSPDEKILYAVDRDGNRIQAFDTHGTFLFAWGKLGNGNGQFHVPYGIDVDIEGNVWVADRANDRMQKFDSKGKFILIW